MFRSTGIACELEVMVPGWLGVVVPRYTYLPAIVIEPNGSGVMKSSGKVVGEYATPENVNESNLASKLPPEAAVAETSNTNQK